MTALGARSFVLTRCCVAPSTCEWLSNGPRKPSYREHVKGCRTARVVGPEWRRDRQDGGWQGRVVYAVDNADGTVLVEAWVAARHLQPAG